MALRYGFEVAMTHPEIKEEEKSSERKTNSVADVGLECDSSNGFDCNICLEFVLDPVVTLCGHLYCWPCIYKWIHSNNTSTEFSVPQPQCPVCKTDVSVTALVPLYGRGKSMRSSGASSHESNVPERPSAPNLWNVLPTSTGHFQYPDHEQQPEPHHPQYASYAGSSVYRLGGTNAFQPIIDILGEMVYSRMSGEPTMTNACEYPNLYNLAGANTPRVRRQLIHADRSLSRLCVFFFCGAVLCLLLF